MSVDFNLPPSDTDDLSWLHPSLRQGFVPDAGEPTADKVEGLFCGNRRRAAQALARIASTVIVAQEETADAAAAERM